MHRLVCGSSGLSCVGSDTGMRPSRLTFRQYTSPFRNHALRVRAATAERTSTTPLFTPFDATAGQYSLPAAELFVCAHGVVLDKGAARGAHGTEFNWSGRLGLDIAAMPRQVGRQRKTLDFLLGRGRSRVLDTLDRSQRNSWLVLEDASRVSTLLCGARHKRDVVDQATVIRGAKCWPRAASLKLVLSRLGPVTSTRKEPASPPSAQLEHLAVFEEQVCPEHWETAPNLQ